MLYPLLIIGAANTLPEVNHPIYLVLASVPVVVTPYFYRRFVVVDDAIYRLEHAARRDDFDPAEHGGNVPFWMRGNHRIYRRGVREILLTAVCMIGGWALLYFVARADGL